LSVFLCVEVKVGRCGVGYAPEGVRGGRLIAAQHCPGVAPRSPLGLGTFAAGNVIGTNRTLVAAPRPAAWRTRLLLGLDCGEQLLHGALRRRTERFVQMNRLCKLLADEVIALRELGVTGKCSLDEIGLAAA
jgi:hypothetical protein